MTGVAASDYDAILVVSFGGPEGPDDVEPFLRNVTRGRHVPAARLAEVAEHYHAVGGRSPINDHNRALVAALQNELAAHGPDLAVYWGNRNWHPLLADTLRSMADDGVGRALTFVTSAFSSYSGCRQYREDLAAARAEVGPDAPELDKLRVFYNHPGFLEPQVDLVAAALAELPDDVRDAAHVVFTTHSIPLTMARHCDYEAQHREAARVVMHDLGTHHPHELVYNSRSGPTHVAWLEPDIGDHLVALDAAGVPAAVVVPIGFVSDHMEVVHDLDVEAADVAVDLDLVLVRAGTVGTDPRFVAMIRELVRERVEPGRARRALGTRGPNHDVCPADCCFTPGQPTAAVVAGPDPHGALASDATA